MESAKQPLEIINDSSQAANPEPIEASSEVSLREKTDLAQVSYRKPDFVEEDAKKVSKNQLINKLNFINFQDGTLLITFEHAKYKKKVTLTAKPQPCLGEILDCLWDNPNEIRQYIKTHLFKNLMITNGQRLIIVEPELEDLNKDGIRLKLPESSYEISSRKVSRHDCEGVLVQFLQNGSLFSGHLLDFNACSFKAELATVPPQTFEWIHPDSPVNVILSNGRETLYSGECAIIRQTAGQDTRTFALKPLKSEIQRFKHKDYRSERYELNPAPNIHFKHPVIQKMIDLKVVDLSGSGFSVEEDEKNSTLLPGLILPEVRLSFTNHFKLKCRAQVVYRKIQEDGRRGRWVKCGLALLDMDIQDHVTLIALLHQTKDRNSYICNQVDLDALWDFFFETGFIYPNKYAFIQKNKKKIKETYEKLYTRNPQIARHFIYQDKGRILGHMATIRFYDNTWLIHHHAARKSALNKAGLIVLDQIGRMINDSHRLHSLHMDYIICYYRPDNKFPSRVFGGAAKSIKDPKGCSLDEFAYFHPGQASTDNAALPEGWNLTNTSTEDLRELGNFYEHVSGGLMVNALDLKPEKLGSDELASEYHSLGLERQRHFYSLKHKDELSAIAVVNLSDIGLNLSDLTNCVKVFVLDTDNLPKEILNSMLSTISNKLQHMEMPVLLYPAAYMDNHDLPYEKLYKLWVCSLQFSDEYFRYLHRLLRFI